MPKSILKFRELYTGRDGFYRVVYGDGSISEGWTTKRGAMFDAEKKAIPLGIVRVRSNEGTMDIPDDLWEEWREAA